MITVATAHGLRTVGCADPNPLDGLDVTTLTAGGGALWALTRNRRIWRIAGGKAERVVRVDGAIGLVPEQAWAPLGQNRARPDCYVSTATVASFARGRLASRCAGRPEGAGRQA